jgi:signal transduction histidine kinase
VRKTLALVSAAVTSMVALAFLIPLAVIVRDVAAERAVTSARLAGDAIEPVLAVTADRATLQRAIASTQAGGAGRLAVYLTSAGAGDGARFGGGLLVGGAQHASPAQLSRAAVTGQSFTTAVPGGYVVLQPVVLGAGVSGGSAAVGAASRSGAAGTDGAADAASRSGAAGTDGTPRLAVIEVYVPGSDVSRGVATSWAIMAAVAMALVGVSVLVADRLAGRVTRPARALAAAAAALGEGDLSARSDPAGPPELVAAGRAFNAMAERLSSLIAAERRMAADLPHRLRTPLTALRMNAASLGTGHAADETRLAVSRLEHEVDLIIRAARRPAPDEPAGCDAAEVLRDRMRFWSALAEDQGRAWHLTGAVRPARVPVSRTDLEAAADALLGNVFRHTAEGTEFAVTLHAGDGVLLIFFADAGPGIRDPDAALRRGSSGAGSTGLGLDIARRVAESTGGGLKIDTSSLGGAQIQLWLRSGTAAAPRRAGSRRLIGRSAQH